MPGDPVSEFTNRIDEYLSDVAQANSEAARALFFLEFARAVFKNVRADRPQLLSPQLEKMVDIRDGTILVKGRIDALLGNVILEFKVALDERSIEEAKEQLRKYVSALWTIDGQRTDYVLMASDGVDFRVYKPTAKAEPEEVSYEKITLDEVNALNLRTASPEDSFKWMDRYLLWRERIPPRSEEVVGAFGPKSPTFSVTTSLMETALQKCGPSVTAPYTEWGKYLGTVYGLPMNDKTLFLKHTYLATLAKLMCYIRYNNGAIPSREEIGKILRGESFREWGIENFLEEDFFSWLSRKEVVGEGVEIAWKLLGVLEHYDLTKVDEDVLKGLYQGLVDPSDRHDLAEFYTPDWLAELIVNGLFESGTPRMKMLDPACGSGTFLAVTIRKKAQMSREKKHNLLYSILSTVEGIDVHPLAVLISKANYLMALGELVKYKEGPIHIPVYLANSIDFPQAQNDIEHGIEVYRYPISGSLSLVMPRLVVESDMASQTVEYLSEYSRKASKDELALDLKAFSNFLQVRANNSSLYGDKVTEVLFETAKTLTALIKQNKDTIYGFIVKNVYRPATIGKFDALMGNPPWLVYRFVRMPEYQKRLKQLVTEEHGLLSDEKTRSLPHMELATLFFVRCASLYLNEHGHIGFVMPRSVFTADHHQNFRMNDFKPKMAFQKVYDFDKNQQERLIPLFSVESCGILAELGASTHYPIQCTLMKGNMGKRNLRLSDVRELIDAGSIVESNHRIRRFKIGGRESWSYEAGSQSEGDISGISPYMEKFRQGASLVPRPYWFVRFVKDPLLGIDPASPVVETTEMASSTAKGESWKGKKFRGQVEKQFLFATILGGDVLPFMHLGYRMVCLPALASGRYSVVTASELSSLGFSHMAAWTKQAEQGYKLGEGLKTKKMDIYHRIDFQKGITDQDARWRLLVLYNRSGRRNLSACTLKVPEKITLAENGAEITATGFIADFSTYLAPIKTAREAAYLTSLLNSEETISVLRKFKAARDITKKVWEIPFPAFNEDKSVHRQLSELGTASGKKAHSLAKKEGLADSMESFSTGQTGRLRRLVREHLSDELVQIDGLVKRLV